MLVSLLHFSRCPCFFIAIHERVLPRVRFQSCSFCFSFFYLLLECLSSKHIKHGPYRIPPPTPTPPIYSFMFACLGKAAKNERDIYLHTFAWLDAVWTSLDFFLVFCSFFYSRTHQVSSLATALLTGCYPCSCTLVEYVFT